MGIQLFVLLFQLIVFLNQLMKISGLMLYYVLVVVHHLYNLVPDFGGKDKAIFSARHESLFLGGCFVGLIMSVNSYS